MLNWDGLYFQYLRSGNGNSKCYFTIHRRHQKEANKRKLCALYEELETERGWGIAECQGGRPAKSVESVISTSFVF